MEKASHKPTSQAVFLAKTKDHVTETDKTNIKKGKWIADEETEPGSLNKEEQMWLIIDALLEKVLKLELQVATLKGGFNKF